MKTRILCIMSVLAFFLNELLMAQLPGLPEAPNQAPIDGGLALLAAAGGGYAIRKLREKRRREEEADS